MSDDTKLYISIQSHAGHLVVDGPMALWRELVGSLALPTAERAAADRSESDHQPAEVSS